MGVGCGMKSRPIGSLIVCVINIASKSNAFAEAHEKEGSWLGLANGIKDLVVVAVSNSIKIKSNFRGSIMRKKGHGWS